MIVDEKRACVCGLNVTAIHLIVVETLCSNVNPMVVPEKTQQISKVIEIHPLEAMDVHDVMPIY